MYGVVIGDKGDKVLEPASEVGTALVQDIFEPHTAFGSHEPIKFAQLLAICTIFALWVPDDPAYGAIELALAIKTFVNEITFDTVQYEARVNSKKRTKQKAMLRIFKPILSTLITRRIYMRVAHMSSRA